MRSVLVFGGFLAAVVACSSSDNPNAANEAAIDANARALCTQLFQCCSQSELAALSFVDSTTPPTLDGCIALHSQNGRAYEGVTNAEAAAHRVAIHLEKSDACVTQVKALSCSDFHARLVRIHLGDIFSLCQSDVVEPLVANDQACRFYFDCQGGSCVGGDAEEADAGADAKGKCAALPPAGQPCASDGCAPGSHCDLDTNTCEALVAKGGACVSDDACTSGACEDGKCISPGRCGG